MARPVIGGLLYASYREIRDEIQAAIEAAGFDDFRLAHQAVFAVLPADGARIGQLAARAQLAKQTMTELVSYLETRGYIERVPDVSDGRAQVVRRTRKGDGLDRVAQDAIRAVERRWRKRLGAERFDALVAALDLLASDYTQPPGGTPSSGRPAADQGKHSATQAQRVD